MDHQDSAIPRPGNRLLGSQSPYLLAHGHNPVDWYPWGPEALEKARRENKPIFLSIGYAACHWCHVMEREVFENQSIAAMMNEHFINIKVDREERPDLDELYMLATQLISGSGGWPMSVWLTPDLQPFYAGTYFPPVDGYGRPGFPRIATAIAEAWKNKPAEIRAHAQTVVRAVEEHSRGSVGGEHTLNLPQVVQACIAHHWSRFDSTWGGFGTAPKFPPSQLLSLLLRVLELGRGDVGWPALPGEDGSGAADHQARIATMLTGTLDGMAAGGIHDQIGGGFARYSTDQRWLVPHFEKMLYDNAQLAGIYARAATALNRPDYQRVARRVLDFWLDHMTSPEGAFFSTLDADSEGREGKFYVWSAQEIRQALPNAEDCQLLTRHLGISDEGNWEGTNVPHIAEPVDRLAAEMGQDAARLQLRIDGLCEKLAAIRQRRAPPALDDKIITGWNGLMISALAVAGQALADARYTAAAMAAVKFIFSRHVNSAGQLLRVSRAGVAGSIPGFLEDYAYLLVGIMDLIRAGSLLPQADAAGLPALARRLATEMAEQFYDAAAGGFFMTHNRHEQLLVRMKTAQDNATPSGTALALHGLLAVDQYRGTQDYRHILENTLRRSARMIGEYPQANSSLLEALLMHAAARPGKSDGSVKQPTTCGAAKPVLDLTVVAVTPVVSSTGDLPAYNIELLLHIEADYYIACRPPTEASSGEGLELRLEGQPDLKIGRVAMAFLPASTGTDETVYRGTVPMSIGCVWQAKPAPGRYDVRVVAKAQVCTTGYCMGGIEAAARAALAVN